MTLRLFKPGAVVETGGIRVVNRNGEGLRIAFRVTKSLTATPDSAEIAVYNLAPERRQALATQFSEFGSGVVRLQAGYDGSLKQLFHGDIRSPFQPHMIEGGDVATRILADDGGDTLADVMLNGIFVAFMPPVDMINTALKAFAYPKPRGGGVTITKHPSVDSVLASRPHLLKAGFSMANIGKATDLLDEAARVLDARWWVHDSVLYMARSGLPVDGLAVLLPRSHWLSEPTEDSEGIVRVRSFMDPMLQPGRQVQLIRSGGKREPFRMEAGVYTGDTDATQPWAVDMALRRVRVEAF